MNKLFIVLLISLVTVWISSLQIHLVLLLVMLVLPATTPGVSVKMRSKQLENKVAMPMDGEEATTQPQPASRLDNGGDAHLADALTPKPERRPW